MYKINFNNEKTFIVNSYNIQENSIEIIGILEKEDFIYKTLFYNIASIQLFDEESNLIWETNSYNKVKDIEISFTAIPDGKMNFSLRLKK